jgi:serine protease Do
LLLLAPLTVVQAQSPGTSDQELDRQYAELAQAADNIETYSKVLKKVVSLIKPAVVHIESEHTDAASGKRPTEETGSGVIIQRDGKFYILTNRHVVKNSPLNKIRIKLADGRLLSPSKVWSDWETDIAVMQVDATDLVAARLGNSDRLDIGDFVVAVGSPFGLSHSVTYGIISAKGRRDLQLAADGLRYQDFLQTDAAINPGNSGGPLVSLRGEIVGINTAIASSSGGNEGIGFSIPINMVTIVATQLIERGTVNRAYLGVQLDGQFNERTAMRLGLGRKWGARVVQITPNSPAAAAKLRSDDVILKFDGVEIEDDNHLINLVSLTPIGKEVPVVVLREQQQQTFRIRVDERRKFEAER